jgi:hypothetical protein
VTSVQVIDRLVWIAFIGDVSFLSIYMGLPPRNWWRYQMGWHLVLFSTSLAIVLGTTALRRQIGPIPLWATCVELGLVGAVTWWRAIWALTMKLKR